MNGELVGLGVIGKSGKFYPCDFTCHLETCVSNKIDAPFVIVHRDFVDFDAYFTADKCYPTKKQFITLMDWCTFNGELFEDMIDCQPEPWEKWIG